MRLWLIPLVLGDIVNLDDLSSSIAAVYDDPRKGDPPKPPGVPKPKAESKLLVGIKSLRARIKSTHEEALTAISHLRNTTASCEKAWKAQGQEVRPDPQNQLLQIIPAMRKQFRDVAHTLAEQAALEQQARNVSARATAMALQSIKVAESKLTNDMGESKTKLQAYMANAQEIHAAAAEAKMMAQQASSLAKQTRVMASPLQQIAKDIEAKYSLISGKNRASVQSKHIFPVLSKNAAPAQFLEKFATENEKLEDSHRKRTLAEKTETKLTGKVERRMPIETMARGRVSTVQLGATSSAKSETANSAHGEATTSAIANSNAVAASIASKTYATVSANKKASMTGTANQKSATAESANGTHAESLVMQDLRELRHMVKTHADPILALGGLRRGRIAHEMRQNAVVAHNDSAQGSMSIRKQKAQEAPEQEKAKVSIVGKQAHTAREIKEHEVVLKRAQGAAVRLGRQRREEAATESWGKAQRKTHEAAGRGAGEKSGSQTHEGAVWEAGEMPGSQKNEEAVREVGEKTGERTHGWAVREARGKAGKQAHGEGATRNAHAGAREEVATTKERNRYEAATAPHVASVNAIRKPDSIHIEHIPAHDSEPEKTMAERIVSLSSTADNTPALAVEIVHGSWWMSLMEILFPPAAPRLSIEEKPHQLKQNWLKTARAVSHEAAHVVDISDAFSALERHDEEAVEIVRAEDTNEAVHAHLDLGDDVPDIANEGYPAIHLQDAFAALEKIDDQAKLRLNRDVPPNEYTFRDMHELTQKQENS